MAVGGSIINGLFVNKAHSDQENDGKGGQESPLLDEVMFIKARVTVNRVEECPDTRELYIDCEDYNSGANYSLYYYRGAHNDTQRNLQFEAALENLTVGSSWVISSNYFVPIDDTITCFDAFFEIERVLPT